MRYDGRGIKCWATGKVVYSEERHAKRAVSLSAHPLDAYPCIECGGFHIGRHRVEQAKKKKRRGGNTMSDNSAGTKVCERCGGSGNNRGGDCPWCSGAGIDTTGAVVGVLPPAVGIGGYVYAPDHNSGATVTDDRDATIAAQAAEIEIVTTDRDVLRLEVQRLKDLNFEAQDLYAAIEAERDELRAEAERLKLRLTESLVELCAAEKEIAHMRESNGRADDYSAKLERVIEALRYELAGVVHCHTATIRSIVRLANAGLELPEVADNE